MYQRFQHFISLNPCSVSSAVRALLSPILLSFTLLLLVMYSGVNDVSDISDFDSYACVNVENGKGARGVATFSGLVEQALAEDGDTNATMYEYLFDWYNMKYDGNHDIWSNTDGTFHTWDATSEYEFDNWQNWYFGVVNGILGIDIDTSTAEISDFYDIIKLDYIIGTYRLLYHTMIGTNGYSWLELIEDQLSSHLPAIDHYLSQMWFDTGTIAARLRTLNEKIDTVNSNLLSIIASLGNETSSDIYTRYIFDRLFDSESDVTLESRIVDLSVDVRNVYPLIRTANSLLQQIHDSMEDLQVESVGIDYSGKLDAIIGLLTLEQAGVLQDLIGDFDKVSFVSSAADLATSLKNVFPFCLMYAAADIVGLLNQTPVAPEWDFHIMFMGQQVGFGLDLSDFEDMRNFSAFICYAAVALALAFGTRRVLYGGGAS